MRFDDAVKDAMRASVLCWCATADQGGAPNVSPKELFAPLDGEALVIADIASPRTIANLRRNPAICVSFVDVFRQQGFKLTGVASVVSRDDRRYAELGEALLSRVGPGCARFPIRGLIHMQVADVARIVAPSYWLRPDEPVETRVAEAMRAYGVRPA